jgi:hypothetical protein
MINPKIQAYLDTVADPDLRMVLTDVLTKVAAPVAAPAEPVAAPAEPVAAPAEPVAAPDKKPTLLDLLTAGSDKTGFVNHTLCVFDQLTPSVPTLIALIPGYATLGADAIGAYDKYYEDVVAGGRRHLDAGDARFVAKMANSIAVTGSHASKEIGAAATALVNACGTQENVSISVQATRDSVTFYPTFGQCGEVSPERTKRLVDAVVQEATAALGSRLAAKWHQLDSYGACMTYRPAGSEGMFKFILSGRSLMAFIPRTTAEGRAEFIRIATLIQPKLAPMLTDGVAKDILTKYGSIEIGSETYEPLLKGIFGDVTYDATALNADIDARGITNAV